MICKKCSYNNQFSDAENCVFCGAKIINRDIGAWLKEECGFDTVTKFEGRGKTPTYYDCRPCKTVGFRLIREMRIELGLTILSICPARLNNSIDGYILICENNDVSRFA